MRERFGEIIWHFVGTKKESVLGKKAHTTLMLVKVKFEATASSSVWKQLWCCVYPNGNQWAGDRKPETDVPRLLLRDGCDNLKSTF